MKVFKYGAVAASIGPNLWEQMRMGHRYYNRLVEAENDRRKKAWGQKGNKGPPHEDCNCKKCKEHWKILTQRLRKAPRFDAKPYRTEASAQGLWWGTYLKIEQAFELACKTTGPCKQVRFKPWRKGQLAAVQIQRGTALEKQFLLEPAPDPRVGRRAQGKCGRYTLRLRIGSAPPGNRTPVWSEPVQLELHRLPQGAPKWAIVTVKHEATRKVAAVHFFCDEVPGRTDLAPRGVVAVDVSWRRGEDGLRVGYARPDRGKIDQLILSPHWIHQSEQADHIRSLRADNLNALKARDPRFAQVRSAGGVRRKIAKLRAAGTLRVGKHLKAWLAKDWHLWQYETGCYRRSRNRRWDALRKWVRELRRRYATVVVKDSQHKELKATREPEERLPQRARRQGQHAAPGETIEILREVFGDQGMAVVSAVHTTNLCTCGHVNDHGPETVVKCEGCGKKEDRDTVSTRNMLELWARGEYTAPTARKRTPKFAKKHTEST